MSPLSAADFIDYVLPDDMPVINDSHLASSASWMLQSFSPQLSSTKFLDFAHFLFENFHEISYEKNPNFADNLFEGAVGNLSFWMFNFACCVAQGGVLSDIPILSTQ